MTPALAYTARLTGAVPDTAIVYPINLVALAIAAALIGIAGLAAILIASGAGARFRHRAPRRPRVRLLPPAQPALSTP